jgi:DNA-binding transcriptional MerR regulator/methylmalonyl-CoA mutase cobalamin-binding subunit
MTEEHESRHPIGVVAARTGIRPDLIRAWERRYEAVVPRRAPKGRRLYTDHDIERLRLLKQLVASGRRISDVASMGFEDLKALALEDAGANVASPRRLTRVLNEGSRGYMLEILGAVEHLDRERLEKALAEAAVALSGPLLRQEVIVPVMQTIGERWREGQLRVVHEHLASAIIRTHLAALRPSDTFAPNAPGMVVTTPAGQRHEFGALLAAAAAAEMGWNVTYLGPNLPAEEMAVAVRQKAARVVALSIVYPADDHSIGEELRKLRRFVGPEIAIIVGGRVAAAYAAVLQEIGAIYLQDLSALPKHLEVLAV